MSEMIHTGKYAGKYVSDLCKDRKYMNWAMTTWAPNTTIPKAIHAHIEHQKMLVKQRHTNRTDPAFMRQWLEVSYEGYKLHGEDLEWAKDLIGTTENAITVGFVKNGYVFQVNGEEFSPVPMVVNERKDVFEAYRHDIQEQIKEFRTRAFHNKRVHVCPETGNNLKNDMDAHTDHHFRKKTFVQLVEEFNKACSVDFKSVEIQNCGMFYRLKDRAIAAKWAEYHREHAVLRLIHVSANTNPEFYIRKYSEAPYEPKPAVPKAAPVQAMRILTFEEVVGKACP